MLAAVYHGRNDVRIQDWPAPGAPPPGWVTVKVSFCGICGTDIDEVLRGPVLVPVKPHPLTGAKPPLVLGHEPSGTVVAAGPGAGLDAGTRVGLENTMGCGLCGRCGGGNPQLCDQMASIGLMSDGALAELVNVPASMCVPIPDGVPDDVAALAEPLSVVVRAVRRAGDLRGQDAIVIGGGTIGLLIAQVARAAGARSVLVSEANPLRLEVARELDLDTVHPTELDRVAPVVFECAGVPAALQAALAATATGGTTMVLGIHAEPQLIDLTAQLLRERSLNVSLSHSLRDDYVPAMDLLRSRSLQIEPLITGRVPLERAIDSGFDALISEPEKHLKILIDCSG